ncbi:hypothetical protein FRC00_010396 [Tulasnella sp. 408]|nr:hypothetical protein FRC00_010396 [Tulasnella sp. 408]
MAYRSPCSAGVRPVALIQDRLTNTNIRTSSTGAKAPQLNGVESSNERHNHADGEASGASLQCSHDSPFKNMYSNDAGNSTSSPDSTTPSGTRYSRFWTTVLARGSTRKMTTGGPATSASSSYASAAATPTEQYAQPHQAYDSQHYADPRQEQHQEQHWQLVKVKVTSPFNHRTPAAAVPGSSIPPTPAAFLPSTNLTLPPGTPGRDHPALHIRRVPALAERSRCTESRAATLL